MTRIDSLPERKRIAVTVLTVFLVSVALGLLVRGKYPAANYSIGEIEASIARLENDIGRARQYPALPDVEATVDAITRLSAIAGIKLALLSAESAAKLEGIVPPENDGRMAIASATQVTGTGATTPQTLAGRMLWLWNLQHFPVDLLRVSTRTDGGFEAILYLRGNTIHQSAGAGHANSQ